MTIEAFGSDRVHGFAQAVRLGQLLFVSGQVAWDEDGRVVGPGDALRQARQAFANLRATLESGGSSLDRVGKITMFATSPDHLGPLREARHELFGPVGHYPASTFVVVSGLASPDLLVEIEAIALVE